MGPEMTSRKNKIYAAIAVVLFAAFVLSSAIGCNDADAQSRSTKNPAYQILRDSTITFPLLSPDLRDTLAFVGANGNVILADSAKKLRLKSLFTSHFTSSSLDSIKAIIVDTAKYGRFVLAGAITSRNAFTAAIFDSIRNHWVLESVFADSSARAGQAANATTAGTATYALNYIGTDTISAARYANVAGYAEVAGSAIAILADITDDQWAEIRDSIEAISGALTKVDSAVLADTARAVRRDGIDSLTDFTSTMQGNYIPTLAQKTAIGRQYRGTQPGAGSDDGALLTGANPPVDSTGAAKNFVFKRTPGQPIFIGFGDHTAAKNEIIIDTSSSSGGAGALRVMPENGDTTVFKDSIAVAAMINAASALDSVDYVLRGANGSPSRISVTNADPGAVNGALWVDTTNLAANDTATLKIYWDSQWNVVGGAGGGGGGAATDLSTARRGTVDADNVLFRDQRDTLFSIIVVGDDSGDSLFAKRVRANQLDVDTILATGDNTIYVRDAWETSIARRWIIGSPTSASSSPNGYFNSIYAGTSSSYTLFAAGTGNITTGSGTDIVPLLTSGSNIGFVTQKFDNVLSRPYNNIYGESIFARDTLRVSNGLQPAYETDYILFTNTSGMRSVNLPVSVENNTFTVSNGNIQHTGGVLSTPSISVSGSGAWNSLGIDLAANDRISLQSGGTIQIPSGARVWIPSDEAFVFTDPTETDSYYVVNHDEKYSLVSACPDVDSANPVVSLQFMKGWVQSAFIVPADTIYDRRANPRRFNYYKAPGCDDSIYFAEPVNNQTVIWPTWYRNPEWFNNSDLILPWDYPGVPVGPYWIDSTTNGLYYNDPGPGYAEHILQVSERFDSRFGFINGKYGTIKEAVDSLPNWRCKLNRAVTTSDSITTFSVNTLAASGTKQISFYRGETLVEDSIQALLPRHLRKEGTYVQMLNTSTTASRWVLPVSWPSDSTFVVEDSTIASMFKSSSTEAFDSAWTLTFAQKSTIQVLPPVSGGVIQIDEKITIHDVCPIRIEGLGENETILTNERNDTTLVATMFETPFVAGYNPCYIGMPIEFANLTIYADTLGGNHNPIIKTSGNTRLENVTIISRISTNNKGVIWHGYHDNSLVLHSLPSVVFDNVTAVLDKNGILLHTLDDSTSFCSYNSAYSIWGDSAAVIYPDENMAYIPQFYGDQFFFRDGAGYVAKTYATQSFDSSISVVQCHFIGKDGVSSDGTAVVRGSWVRIIPSGNNSYNSVMAQAPSRLKRGSLPIKTFWASK